MDNLVLQQVSRQLHRELDGALLDRLTAEGAARLRLTFEAEGGPAHLTLCWQRDAPWAGYAPPPARGRKRRSDPWMASLRHLAGERLAAVEKTPRDRRLALIFRSRRRLILELLPGRAALVLTDRDGAIEATVGAGRATRRRLVTGEPYRAPSPPQGGFDPFTAPASELTHYIEREGMSPAEGARRWSRAFPGLGPAGAQLLLDELAQGTRNAGERLRSLLDALLDGETAPWIEADSDPAAGDLADGGDPATMRLHPWLPAGRDPEPPLFRGSTPAHTAGLFHTLLDSHRERVAHGGALVGILRRERARVDAARLRAAGDLERFADPDRSRRWGEALLAGLSAARRVGDRVFVPDPYDAAAGDLAVPAPAGKALTEVAEGHFAAHRRARRGKERAAERLSRLKERSERLARIGERYDLPCGSAELTELAAAMRQEGLAVGIAAGTRAAREAGRGSPPRLEGVRVFESSDGLTVMVGKSGRDNHRLTFKLAGPEDFWLHALGVPGAHVVVRNPERAARPPTATLAEAAAAAAWFSEARRQPRTDVQWTRRKNVRRPRGAAPGTVVLKRFETLRVVPRLPAALDDGPN